MSFEMISEICPASEVYAFGLVGSPLSRFCFAVQEGYFCDSAWLNGCTHGIAGSFCHFDELTQTVTNPFEDPFFVEEQRQKGKLYPYWYLLSGQGRNGSPLRGEAISNEPEELALFNKLQ
eukprot:Gb_30401 [translate_table: standard]